MTGDKKRVFQRGNLLIGVLFIIVILMIIPFALKIVLPASDLVFKIVLIFSIYSFVTQLMQSNNTLTLLITGVLVYFMVFKYGDLFVSLWFVTTVFAIASGTLIVTAARDFLGFGDSPGGGMSHPPH
ncbi:MAG: hypothetical protein AABW68_00565 [archaeon]|mgnify:CR=1 FL=1